MNQFKEPSPTGQSGAKKQTIIFSTIIVVLLAMVVYLFITKNQLQTTQELTTTTMQRQIDSVKSNHAALQSDFNAASARIDLLVSQNTKLDSTLQGKQVEMRKLQHKISAILKDKNATEQQLSEARQMIAQLTDKTKDYEARIAELEKQNTDLTDKNRVLAHEVDSTVTQNISLKKVASVLHTSNLRMAPIHKRRSGREKQTVKARKVDALKITFDIDENSIAGSGNKQMYIRIVGPDGKVLNGNNNVSGMLTTSEGQPVNYSLMKEVALNQNQLVKDVSVEWNQGSNYQRGNYTIEIYNDGYKVGNGSVKLN